MLLILFILPLALSFATSNLPETFPSPPKWPIAFSQSFIESYSTTTTHIQGKVYYNSTADLMRVDRSNGQFDMFCSSIFPNVSTSCSIVMREKKRYMIYPQRRICCYCCDQKHGCGVPPNDFLSGSTYEGYESLGGDQFYHKWKYTTGTLDNFYYQTIDSKRIPRRFANNNKTDTDLNVNSFSTEKIGDNVFVLPDYCYPTMVCPLTSICGRLQQKSKKDVKLDKETTITQ